MFHIFHCLESHIGFRILNRFSVKLKSNAISSEDFIAIPVNLHRRQGSEVFTPRLNPDWPIQIFRALVVCNGARP